MSVGSKNTLASSPTPSHSNIFNRLLSIDAFRGLTILGMILFIALAAGGYQRESPPLPFTCNWMGSLPISTFFHADYGADLWKERKIEELTQKGIPQEEAKRAFNQIEAHAANYVAENNVINTWSYEILSQEGDTYQRAKWGIGVTITDLVAPWFMLIMGICVPLSLSKHIDTPEFWKRVWKRTFLLILTGMLYISLVLKQTSLWWGILQTIGIAYLCAALFYRAPKKLRWPLLIFIACFNLWMTSSFPWWTNAWEEIERPFGTLTVPTGNWLKIWKLHCQPWLSISYGMMAMIGVLIGEALLPFYSTQSHSSDSSHARTLSKSTLLTWLKIFGIGLFFTLAGYAIHTFGFYSGHYAFCMIKSDVTTSYAFFTAGLGVLAYLFFYLVIDYWKITFWIFPLTVFGMNPLLAYFMQIVVRRTLESLGLYGFFERVTSQNVIIQNWALFFSDKTSKPSAAVLAFFSKAGWMGVFWGLLWTSLVWLVVLYCNRKKIYWKL